MKKLAIITGLMLAASINPLSAQHTIAHEEYNALKYLQQRRHYYQQRPFNSHAKGKNISLGAFGGMSFSPSNQPPRHSYEFGLNVSKQLSALHTLRVGGLFSFADTNKEVCDHFYRYGMEVDHLFDIFSYLAGYHTNRHYEIYTVAGLGAYFASAGSHHTEFAAGLHAGLHLAKHISSHWDLYVEPRFHLLSDGFDGNITSNIDNERFHIASQVLVGTRYHFTGPIQMPHLHFRPLENIYYELYAGLQGDYDYRVTSQIEHKLKPLGPVVGMSIGKWFLPFGVRSTLFTGFHKVPSSDRKDIDEEFYGGLRIEAMVNLNNLFNHSITRPVVEVNASLGGEAGVLAHRPGNRYKEGYKPFWGLTTALQALVPLTDNYGIFIQGRFSPSTFRQRYRLGGTWNTSMHNCGVEIGMQYRRRETTPDFHHPFTPYWFFSAAFGGNFVVNTSTLNSPLDLFRNHLLGTNYLFSFGRRLTRYSTLRASVDTGNYPLPKSTHAHPISFSADYMFDITSLFRGYREDRFFTLSPYAGVVYTHTDRSTVGGERYRPTSTGNYFALQLGFNQDFRINDRCGIFIEENLRIYKHQVLPGARLFTGQHLSAIANANLGFRWKW